MGFCVGWWRQPRSSSESTSAVSMPACSTASPERSRRCGNKRDAQDARPNSRLHCLLPVDDQLDQWFMAHPHEVFTRSPEPAVINPSNPWVLHPHLACAAYELPLTHADERWWPDLLDEGVRLLVQSDELKLRMRGRASVREPMAVWAGRGWPAQGIGLRSDSSDEVRIALSDGTLIGTVDTGRACGSVHPGAIYLHRGQSFRVIALDLDDRSAIVEPDDGATYTQPRTDTDMTVLSLTRPAASGERCSHWVLCASCHV